MGKMSEMYAVIKKLRDTAASINAVADYLFSVFGGEKPDDEAEEPLTLEEVRAVLANKSRDGFTAQIRELLQKYGADRLSAVDPANYKALLRDAEELTDAG
nr:MAG TPA: TRANSCRIPTION FACTOR IIF TRANSCRIPTION FACTOR, RAP74, RAP30.02A [Caudoviricetes sp.]